jgi:uroporphyrinogen decarboxylase
MGKERRPDFKNLAAILERRAPERPTLFEYFLNDRLYTRFSGIVAPDPSDLYASAARLAKAFCGAGYDYVTLSCPWAFPSSQPAAELASHSLNHEPVIFDRASFDRYPWPDFASKDYSYIEKVASELPEGMGIVMAASDGILETATALLGYDNLCLMLYDDEELVSDIFDRIGSILCAYYKKVLTLPGVRAILCNDDWGFHSQTLIAPKQLRKYVFPWYDECCKRAHEGGRYTILHSCGAHREILDDIIRMGFDARHSYEDKILPVEDAYREYAGRIAVVGGIDVDFLCRRSPEEIRKRAQDLLKMTGCVGYALGSGNSIPAYVPDEHYLAMTSAALDG